jgi:hypothetical protein
LSFTFFALLSRKIVEISGIQQDTRDLLAIHLIFRASEGNDSNFVLRNRHIRSLCRPAEGES